MRVLWAQVQGSRFDRFAQGLHRPEYRLDHYRLRHGESGVGRRQADDRGAVGPTRPRALGSLGLTIPEEIQRLRVRAS